MKKIGEILKNARRHKGYSYKDLENITKIKMNFVEDIEEERWQDLPSFPTVLGFIKSISGSLGLDEKMTVAIFKRDYSLDKPDVNPKKDIAPKPGWNPKTTFILGISLVVLSILGYLGFQYASFISSPKVIIESPIDGQIINGDTVKVFGSTQVDVKITVDNQPVLVDKDGKFSVDIRVSKDTKEIIITGESRSGKRTVISRRIQTEQ